MSEPDKLAVVVLTMTGLTSILSISTNIAKTPYRLWCLNGLH